MTDDTEELMEVMAALRAVAAGDTSSATRSVLDRVKARALGGGRNNAIYGCTLATGEDVCLKLHRADGRQRARREWDCLQVLGRAAAGLAPTPLLFEAGEPEAIAMTYLPGKRLDGARLSDVQIEALAEALQAQHAVGPTSTRRPLLDVRLDEHGLMDHVGAFWAEEPSTTTSLQCELVELWASWSIGPDGTALGAPAPRVLGQGDGNLANCLWDGQRIRFVDFEYGGWSNRSFELALLIEHVQSRNTPEQSWAALVESQDLTAAEQDRLLPARRVSAWFWTVTLWRTGGGIGEAFARQAARLIELIAGNC